MINNNKKYNKIDLLVSMIIGILITIIILGIIYNKEEIKDLIPHEEFNLSYKKIISNCENKTLDESSKCVNNIVKNMYNYNLTNVEKNLSYFSLQLEGGVCRHWSKLYCDLGKELGFNTQEVKISTGKEMFVVEENNKYSMMREYSTSHVFCIWIGKNREGYVILDQKLRYSNKFDNNIK